MRKYIALIILAMAVVAGATLTTPRPPGPDYHKVTPQWNYQLVRSVTADDTPLAAGTKSWADADGTFAPIERWNQVELAFYGYKSGGPTSTFTFKVFAVPYLGGVKTVFEGTATVGGIDLSHNPYTGAELNSGAVSTDYEWVDTITTTSDVWIGDVTLSGNAGGETGGNIATLTFDTFGHYGLYVEFTNVNGDDVTSITCVMRGI